MADTAKRFVGPVQLNGSNTTMYTVPPTATAILRYLRIENVNSSDRTFSLSIGADGPATRIFNARTVPGSGAFEWSGSIPMVAGEILQGSASGAGYLTIIITGVEVTP